MALDIAGMFFLTAFAARIISKFGFESEYTYTAQVVFIYLTIASLIVSAKVRGTVVQDKKAQM